MAKMESRARTKHEASEKLHTTENKHLDRIPKNPQALAFVLAAAVREREERSTPIYTLCWERNRRPPPSAPSPCGQSGLFQAPPHERVATHSAHAARRRLSRPVLRALTPTMDADWPRTPPAETPRPASTRPLALPDAVEHRARLARLEV